MLKGFLLSADVPYLWETQENLYMKTAGETLNQPDNVRSIEQMVKDYNQKKEERRVRKLKEKESQQSGDDVIQS